MRALLYHGRGDVRLEEVDEPVPGPGEVLVDVRFNGLCATDVTEFFEGPFATTTESHPLTGVSLPAILGHELSGVVRSAGDGVDDLHAGALVAVEPIETCGHCPRCRHGSRHLCRDIAFHGYNRPGGGLSERTVVRRDMVHVLPPSVSAELGALVEPLAVSHRAARRTGARPGDLVAVHGAGPIGLGALLALRANGVDVLVSDPSPDRRAAATRLGAEHVVDPAETNVVSALRDLTGGLGAAGAIDAAGAERAFQAAVRSIRPDGTLVVVGHHHDPIQLKSWSLIGSEVQVTGSVIYDRADIEAVIAAMAAGAYPLDGWVTTIGLDQVVEDGLVPLHEQRANKILVDVSG